MKNTVFLENEDLKNTGFKDIDTIDKIIAFIIDKLLISEFEVRSLFMQKKDSYYGDYMQFFVEFDILPTPQAENTLYDNISSAVFDNFEKDAYFAMVGSASFAESKKDAVLVWQH